MSINASASQAVGKPGTLRGGVKPGQSQPGKDGRLEAFEDEEGRTGAAWSETVASTRVKGDWLEVTVTNSWFLVPRGTRLQFAQKIWRDWAALASPSRLDDAHIRIVDVSGNEVAKSSALGGSSVELVGEN
jgi:hypothetical protein